MKLILKRILLFTMVISLYSCSVIKNEDSTVDAVFGTKDYADALVSTIRPLWFTGSKSYRLTKQNGTVAPHLLFDTKPGIDMEKMRLNFVVKTPIDSRLKYDIDLPSGQRYVSKMFCAQEDVWESYDKKIYKPNYTSGIVPRIMDQLGEPQEIIVFGGKEYIQQNFAGNFFDAVIIGGFIEQVCPKGGCLKLGEWQSRIKLVGVLAGDDAYKNIKSLEDLKTIVDWPYTKAFIENGEGKNIVAGNAYPAIRMGAFLSAKQALRYIDQNSIQLSNKKLYDMRKSCQKLYNYTWNTLGVKSDAEVEALKFKDLKLRASYFSKNRNQINDLFFKRFTKYFRQYHDEFLTCSNYMYPSNINEDRDRHWFFSYLTSLHKIVGLGYSYDCKRTMWTQNPVMANGQKMLPLNKIFKGCDARNIDFAIEHAPDFLSDLRAKNYESFRYLDYDRGSFGTHEKIYSWVKTNSRGYQCIDGNTRPVVKETFPSDIKWKRRSLKIKMIDGVQL